MDSNVRRELEAVRGAAWSLFEDLRSGEVDAEQAEQQNEVLATLYDVLHLQLHHDTHEEPERPESEKVAEAAAKSEKKKGGWRGR